MPMLHVDAHFVPGRGHACCEDFAWAEDGPGGAFAVVCDGCTSVPHTDVGARVLALCAARQLRDGRRVELPALVRRARGIVRALGLDSSSLSSTMMWARRTGSSVEIEVHGDGVVAARRRDGRLEVWTLQFPSGAPDYPIYADELEDDHPYRRDGADRWTLEHRVGDWPLVHRSGRGPLRWSLPLRGYDRVALLSDGATAFTHAHHTVPVDLVVRRLVAFRSVHGRFAARRLRRLVGRECDQLDWAAQDDVSLAALCWEDAA
jgi:hypothetical protein